MSIDVSQLIIRKASPGDCAGIRQVHRGCDDPWSNDPECRAWVTRRLESGFYIQVAQYRDRIIGHGEWVVSDEPKGRMLYLGMLQIDEEYQHVGIGRIMLQDGEAYARSTGCSSIHTIPDRDNHAEIFYEKCGFNMGKVITSCVMSAEKPWGDGSHRVPLVSIPFEVIPEYPFIFGLAQPSSRHMWECCNRKPATDDRHTPSARLGDGSYVQLSYFNQTDPALVLFWSKSGDLEARIKEILSFGRECGLERLRFVFYNEYAPLFQRVAVTEENREMALAVAG